MLREEAQERLQVLARPVRDESPSVGPAIHAPGALVARVVQQLRPLARRGGAPGQAALEVHHAAAQGPQDGVRRARVPLEGGVVGEDVQVHEALDHAQALVPGARGVEHAVSADTRQRRPHRVPLAAADDCGEARGARVLSLGAGPLAPQLGDGGQQGVDVGAHVGEAPEAPSFPPAGETPRERRQTPTSRSKCLNTFVLISERERREKRP